MEESPPIQPGPSRYDRLLRANRFEAPGTALFNGRHLHSFHRFSNIMRFKTPPPLKSLFARGKTLSKADIKPRDMHLWPLQWNIQAPQSAQTGFRVVKLDR